MLKHKWPMILSLLTALCLSACVAITPPPEPQAPPQAPSQAVATPAPVHWSYTGEAGPDAWGTLSPDYALCDDGTTQSPIDMAQFTETDLENIVFSYQLSNLNMVNNGHTIQVNYDEGSFIEVDGVRYDLLQFHFHAPSEHLIDSQPSDGELHLVHKSADGATAVVGLFLLQGEIENASLAPIFDNLPAEEGQVQTIDTQINAGFFLPMGKGTFRYGGSLTTPPCTEGVSWFLMTLPIEISVEQFAAFTAIIDANNRPVQPVNDRAVTEDTTH
jgi:carbonic anhydrase